ncbi:MAG: ornithine carbamoyltransferase [Myxococcales bacterium]|nr:ornithine carbamoyltransferase [Myxococcales bacterium]
MPRHFRKVTDLSIPALHELFDLTREVKRHPDRFGRALEGRTLAMIFEKPSLRTRVTFQTGIFQMGGQGIYLGPADIQLGKRESLFDIAANLSRWVDAIMIRTFGHHLIDGMAEHSDVPVINGLSDKFHPCQALADFFTLQEHTGKLAGKTLAWVGDGNNVLHSLALCGAMLGMHIRYATPSTHVPDEAVMNEARAIAKETGGSIHGCFEPAEAVAGAHAVYTDVWASMGQESEADERKQIFAEFQVNAALMQKALPDAFFMHCLPAHRGEEVTDEVVDAGYSIVFDQAENRLHAQKALMLTLMRR